MSRALAAEWTKLRTLPGSAWLLMAAVAGTVVAGAAWTAAAHGAGCPPPGCRLDLPRLALAGVWFGQVAVVVLAVQATAGEFDTRMVQATLVALPRRGRVLAAKAAVVGATVLAAGTLAVAGSLLAAQLLAGDGGGWPVAAVEPSPVSGPTLRAAAGTVLYLGLVALLALGAGTVVRDTAGALTAVLTLLYGFPVVAGLVADAAWRERLQQVGPMPAGLAVQATRDLDQLPIGPLAGLGVLAAWTGAAVLLGAALFVRRDIGA